MMFTNAKLESDFRAWLRSRGEWDAFLAGIRRGLQPVDPELQALAEAAGADAPTVNELFRLRESAKRHESEAKKFPAAGRELERLRAAEKKAEAAVESSSAAELESRRIDFQLTHEATMTFHRQSYQDARHAHDRVETARACGVF